jgi:hypothetical protein
LSAKLPLDRRRAFSHSRKIERDGDRMMDSKKAVGDNPERHLPVSETGHLVENPGYTSVIR